MSLVTPTKPQLDWGAHTAEPSVHHDDQKLPHSLEAAPLPLIATLFRRYGCRPRAMSSWPTWAKLFLKSFIAMPFRYQERHSIDRQQALKSWLQPPVFIIGHWRSGTTYLHNLMTQDDQFGFLSMRHCVAANSFLTLPNWVAEKVASKMPSNRPVDGVEMGWNHPQEEEFALERMTDLSYNHCYLFPDKAEDIFRRCVLFETGNADRQRWMQTYDQLLHRLNYDQIGQTLCLKNPPNTARIRLLHEQYPDAKFIFIVRHPEHVFRSTRKLWRTVTRMLGLSSCPDHVLEENLLLFYELLMQKYLSERYRIPSRQLIEIRYEDLDANPMETLARIYDHLQLFGFSRAEPAFREYIGLHSRFVKNRHLMSASELNQIRDRWGFAYNAWNYEEVHDYRKAA